MGMKAHNGTRGTAAALDLLDRAAGALAQAGRDTTTHDRYIDAHLGALRSAAALLVARSQRGSSLSGAPTVWDGLARLAPELAEWTQYFALCGRRRAELEGGARASQREADDLLRSAETFLALIQSALGLPVTRGEPALAVAWRG
jgi:hypothetical protein